MSVAQGGSGGPWEAVGVTTTEDELSFWCKENVLKVLVVMDADSNTFQMWSAANFSSQQLFCNKEAAQYLILSQ